MPADGLPIIFDSPTLKRKVVNFAAGPAKLPEKVVQRAQSESFNYKGSGISVMELSHRGPQFAEIIQTAEKNLRELLNVPDNYKVLFLQGGGTGQFAAVPLNLTSGSEDEADYLVTGTWSDKAAKEAARYCKVNLVLPKTKKYTGIAPRADWKLSSNARYVYYCANETVHGVEFQDIPDVGDVPLVCDMSSNILSGPVDVTKFGVIIAGAQKNIGCAGVTVVIVRDDLIGHARKQCPSILDYAAIRDAKSLYNTPPTYSIYVMGLVFEWLKEQGGAAAIHQSSANKADSLYEVLDMYSDFYASPVSPAARSRMNVPFRVGGPDGNTQLEGDFLKLAEQRGLMQLKGHRSVGGIRASLYNAITESEVKRLTDFMIEFYHQHSQ